MMSSEWDELDEKMRLAPSRPDPLRLLVIFAGSPQTPLLLRGICKPKEYPFGPLQDPRVLSRFRDKGGGLLAAILHLLPLFSLLAISGHALEGMQAVISETGELEGQNPDIIAFGHLQLLYRSISQPQVSDNLRPNNGTAGSKKSPCALLQQRGHPIPGAQPPPDCVVLNRYGSYP
jgi:hypothetical protein